MHQKPRRKLKRLTDDDDDRVHIIKTAYAIKISRWEGSILPTTTLTASTDRITNIAKKMTIGEYKKSWFNCNVQRNIEFRNLMTL